MSPKYTDQYFLWVGLTDLVKNSRVNLRATIICSIRSEFGEVLRGCPMEKGDKIRKARRGDFFVGRPKTRPRMPSVSSLVPWSVREVSRVFRAGGGPDLATWW